MRTKKISLGIIKINNGIMVSDPCYGLDCGWNRVFSDVVQGEYNAFVRISATGGYGERVKELTICHNSKKLSKYNQNDMVALVGVDSGTCGFYDYDYYENTHNELNADENWYEKNVLNRFYETKEQAFVTDEMGIHSCSGFGDGLYRVYAKKNANNLIDQMTIEFLG
jgi:hypothetical protein